MPSALSHQSLHQSVSTYGVAPEEVLASTAADFWSEDGSERAVGTAPEGEGRAFGSNEHVGHSKNGETNTQQLRIIHKRLLPQRHATSDRSVRGRNGFLIASPAPSIHTNVSRGWLAVQRFALLRIQDG